MLKLITKVIHKNPFNEIFEGKANHQTFSSAMVHYQSFGPEKRMHISMKAYQKLNSKTLKKSTLATLIFFDLISRSNPQFCSKMPNAVLELSSEQSKKKMNCIAKSEKDKLSLNTFIYFYVQFLEIEIWTKQPFKSINLLKEGLDYFEASIESLRLFLKYDFVIEYCLKNQQSLCCIATEFILGRIHKDWCNMIKFVDRWNYVIFQPSRHCFRMNKIYEQVIHISKQLDKLEWIMKVGEFQYSFPKYILDPELNKKIEKRMLEKNSQKLKFQQILRETNSKEDFGEFPEKRNKTKTGFLSEDENTECCFDRKII